MLLVEWDLFLFFLLDGEQKFRKNDLAWQSQTWNDSGHHTLETNGHGKSSKQVKYLFTGECFTANSQHGLQVKWHLILRVQEQHTHRVWIFPVCLSIKIVKKIDDFQSSLFFFVFFPPLVKHNGATQWLFCVCVWKWINSNLFSDAAFWYFFFSSSLFFSCVQSILSNYHPPPPPLPQIRFVSAVNRQSTRISVYKTYRLA